MSSVLPDAREQGALEVGSLVVLALGGAVGTAMFLAGSALLVTALPSYRSSETVLEGVLFTPFGLALALVGLSIIMTTIPSILWVRGRAALRRAHPAEPWMWRPEWVTGRISNQPGYKAGRTIASALLWNTFSIALVLIAPREAWATDPVFQFALIIPGIGLVLLLRAALAMMRQRKFRSSILTLTRVPARPGASFRGAIETAISPETSMSDGSFTVTLRCVNVYITGSGKNETTRYRTLWESTASVPFAACPPGMQGGLTVPVSIAIPGDAAPTTDANARDQIVWRLLAKAELPGIDYDTEWDVPVY